LFEGAPEQIKELVNECEGRQHYLSMIEGDVTLHKGCFPKEFEKYPLKLSSLLGGAGTRGNRIENV
jgi:hypothetical protein